MQEILEEEEILLQKIDTKENIVNMLTNVVTRAKFEYCLHLVKIQHLNIQHFGSYEYSPRSLSFGSSNLCSSLPTLIEYVALEDVGLIRRTSVFGIVFLSFLLYLIVLFSVIYCLIHFITLKSTQ